MFFDSLIASRYASTVLSVTSIVSVAMSCSWLTILYSTLSISCLAAAQISRAIFSCFLGYVFLISIALLSVLSSSCCLSFTFCLRFSSTGSVRLKLANNIGKNESNDFVTHSFFLCSYLNQYRLRNRQ
ncbi:hypothetical protein EDC96DRAFT_498298 [Choanephora cucurbitarum]|nr:hypothetical protein EDC96DRAFT_498298 [Choanephora cucurbitarum]